MRGRYFVVLTVIVLAVILGAALPALAAGHPPYSTAGRQTLRHTVAASQASQRSTDACPWPAQRPVDGSGGSACPQPTRLPTPLRPTAPARSRIDPPDRGVCVTRPGLPCPRPPSSAK